MAPVRSWVPGFGRRVFEELRYVHVSGRVVVKCLVLFAAADATGQSRGGRRHQGHRSSIDADAVAVGQRIVRRPNKHDHGTSSRTSANSSIRSFRVGHHGRVDFGAGSTNRRQPRNRNSSPSSTAMATARSASRNSRRPPARPVSAVRPPTRYLRKLMAIATVRLAKTSSPKPITVAIPHHRVGGGGGAGPGGLIRCCQALAPTAPRPRPRPMPTVRPRRPLATPTAARSI